ncbi:MAG: geranylgeranyl diphosphate synthase type II [Arenicella sp.]|jgi:geranylgeranyl diphosphate synthase type II
MKKDENPKKMLSQLDTYRDYISTKISNTQFPSNPKNLYEPAEYTLNLGGKRMRPILSMMACELFSGEFEKATNVALGVEIFHNFTLIHDDIMDDAPLRRGNVTVHEKWNTNVAILSGNILLIESYKRLAEYKGDILPSILELYNQTAIEVCEGQQMDMDFEESDSVSIDQYVRMIQLKTAVLLGCSLKLGAIVGGASETDANDVYDFGTNLGIAFQLQDDILDVYADQNKFGKQVGGDIIANKKTFLLLTALADANDTQRQQLEKLFLEQDLEKKVKEVKEIYAELQIREKAEAQMDTFYKTAMQNLNSISATDEEKMPLRAIAMFLMDRES